MNKEPLYVKLASLIEARENCKRSGNTEWLERHTDRLHKLVADHMPRGSGIDAGTTINADKSTSEKLVFATSFHHMNEGGMYDGWTNHTVTVRASLHHRILMTITGRDRNDDIKEHLHECFYTALIMEVE